MSGALGSGESAGGWGYDLDRGALIPETVGTLATNAGPRSHDAGNFHSNQAVDAGYIMPQVQQGVMIDTGYARIDETAPMLNARCKDGPMRDQVGVMRCATQETCVAQQLPCGTGDGEVSHSLQTHAGGPRCPSEETYVVAPQPYIVHAANGNAPGLARTDEVANCIHTAGSFSGAQGGTVVAQPTAQVNLVVMNDDRPAHTLRGEGFDGAEDGTQRGTPLAALQITEAVPGDGAIPLLEVDARINEADPGRAGLGIGGPGDPMFSLQASHRHGIAHPIEGAIGFSGTSRGSWAPPSVATGNEVAPTLNLTSEACVAAPQGHVHVTAVDTSQTLTGRGFNPGSPQGGMTVMQRIAADLDPITFQPRFYSDRPLMSGEPSDVAHPLTTAGGDAAPHIVYEESLAFEPRCFTCGNLIDGAPDAISPPPGDTDQKNGDAAPHVVVLIADLHTRGHPPAVAFDRYVRSDVGEVAPTLRSGSFDRSHQTGPAGFVPCVAHEDETLAFDCKDDGADAGEVAPTLRALSHVAGRPNGGGQLAIVIPAGEPPGSTAWTPALRGRDGATLPEPGDEVANALKADQGGAVRAYILVREDDEAPAYGVQTANSSMRGDVTATDIAWAVQSRPILSPCAATARAACQWNRGTSTDGRANRICIGLADDVSEIPATGQQHAVVIATPDAPAVAIRTAQTGANGHGIADDVAHTLDSAVQAVAFAQNQRDEVRELDVAGALSAETGTHQTTYVAQRADPFSIMENCRGDVYANDVTPPLTAGGGKPGQSYPAVVVPDPPADRQRGEMSSKVSEDIMPTLCAAEGTGGTQPRVAQSEVPELATFQQNSLNGRGTFGYDDQGGPARPVTAGADRQFLQTRYVVRRLTPGECEALQGFPRGYTDVPYRGKPAADGNRYKALGNSMAVPVMNRIGRRIRLMDGLLRAMGSGDLHLTPAAARAFMQPEAGGTMGWGWAASPATTAVVKDDAADLVEEVEEASTAPAVGWAWRPRQAVPTMGDEGETP